MSFAKSGRKSSTTLGLLLDCVIVIPVDDAVQRALIAKGNPVLEVHVAEHRARGKAEAVLAVLTARKVEVRDADRVRILREQTPVQLDRWIA